MNIDYSKLKRNYKENPLKKGEQPELEDIKYLFLELNLSREECAQVCNCGSEKIKLFCQKNKICKTKEQKNELRKRTTLEKYGVENISQLEEIKQEKEITCLKNHGVTNGAKSKQGKEKSKRTCKLRYGTEYYFQSEDYKVKNQKTLKRKYKKDNVMQVKEILEKQRQTTFDNHGVYNIQQNKQIHEQSLQTRIEKYGDTRLFGSKSFYEKAKETWLKNLGVDNPSKSEIVQRNLDLIRPQIIDKMIQTKKERGNLNKSNEEKLTINLLEKSFEVKTQYKTKEYPFLCDCYIPSLDLYLEFNYHWTHENIPFQDNSECRKILNKWQIKAETSDYYVNALETWTIRDPLKRKVAKENKLNWLEFFSMKEFIEWYNNICEILK